MCNTVAVIQYVLGQRGRQRGRRLHSCWNSCRVP